MSNKRFTLLPNQIWKYAGTEEYAIIVGVDEQIIRFRMLTDNDNGHINTRTINDFLFWYFFIQ
jgi:hypothetical protein